MKKFDFDSAEFRSIVWDIDARLCALREALYNAEEAEAEAGRVFDETETDEAWDALNAATAERKHITQTMDDMHKLAEAMYSAAVAFDSLCNENEQELKSLGLI